MKNKDININDDVELFSDSLTGEIPRIVDRFQWAREQEKKMNANNLYLWQNILYFYKQARNCYCCGLYFAAIQVIGSSIEVGFKQIYLDHFPEIFNNKSKSMGLKDCTDFAYSNNIISSELKQRIDQFRSEIRNLATHPRPLMPLTFGGKELAPGSWVSNGAEGFTSPEDAAKEGLICFLYLCKEFDDWKKEHTGFKD